MRSALKVSPKVHSGYRAVPASRRSGAPSKVSLSLGELVATAFDVVGADVSQVARVLGSPLMNRAISRRIVVF